MNRQRARGFAQRGNRTASEQFQCVEQRKSLLHGFFGRGVEPRELPHIGFAQRRELKHGTAQIDALDFGYGLFGAPAMARFVPEAHAHARCGAPGATGTLICGRARNWNEPQPVHAHARRELHLPREAGVDYRGHAVNCHRRFRDVRCEYNLPPVELLKRTVLLFRRQVAVQRKHDDVALACERFKLSGGLANLTQSGKECEYVAIAFIHHVANGVRDRE